MTVNVLLVEPFYTGSHRAFAEGLAAASAHRIKLLTHPGRFWKWRMRGSAVTLADQANRLDFDYDVLLCSDMLSVAEFLSLLKRPAPVVLYMHENQLSYPVPQGETRDVQFGFTNITSCLAAQRVVFNSRYHQETFFEALPGFLRLMPDCRPKRVVERIRAKSEVLHLGVDLKFFDRFPRTGDEGPAVILWNHRWEFDKRPEMFFAALDRLAAAGVDFRLIVCGENFQVQPKEFLSARVRLGQRIIHMGYAEDRADYARLLKAAHIVVSTALAENFGVSVVEAVYCGAYPLLPRGLSYTELLPAEFHRAHLYATLDELVLKLKKVIEDRQGREERSAQLREAFARFDWTVRIREYDLLLAKVAEEYKVRR